MNSSIASKYISGSVRSRTKSLSRTSKCHRVNKLLFIYSIYPSMERLLPIGPRPYTSPIVHYHRGGKNRGPTGTRTQGLWLTMRALCQLSYRATWSSFDISPCLYRFVPESARNNGGTTRHALFDARCPSREPTLATKCHRGGKNRGPTGTRTQGLSLTVRELCHRATEPHSRPLIFSPCFNRLTFHPCPWVLY